MARNIVRLLFNEWKTNGTQFWHLQTVDDLETRKELGKVNEVGHLGIWKTIGEVEIWIHEENERRHGSEEDDVDLWWSIWSRESSEVVKEGEGERGRTRGAPIG